MSQVNYNAISDYAARTAVDVNSIMSAFQTQSTNLTSENVADEGLDESSLGTACLTDGRQSVSYTAGLADAPTALGFVAPATYYLVNIGAGPTSFSSTNGGAGWFIGQGIGSLRLTFGAYWRYTWPTASGNTSPIITVKLQYRIDGAAGWTDVTYSDFQFQAVQDVWYEAGVGTYWSTPYWYETMCYEFDIPVPQDGVQHTINEVRVVMASSAIIAPADFQMNDVVLHAERYIKAVT